MAAFPGQRYQSQRRDRVADPRKYSRSYKAAATTAFLPRIERWRQMIPEDRRGPVRTAGRSMGAGRREIRPRACRQPVALPAIRRRASGPVTGRSGGGGAVREGSHDRSGQDLVIECPNGMCTPYARLSDQNGEQDATDHHFLDAVAGHA